MVAGGAMEWFFRIVLNVNLCAIAMALPPQLQVCGYEAQHPRLFCCFNLMLAC